MDFVQIVEEAVVSGAAAAAKDQASAAVTGAAALLRGLLGRVFGADPVGRTAVEKLHDGPEAEAGVWREQLRARLQALPEAELRELVAQAQAVLAVSDPAGTAAGRYTITAAQIGTTVAGDVAIHAEDHSVAGWNVGNVSLGGSVPVDPPLPGRSST